MNSFRPLNRFHVIRVAGSDVDLMDHWSALDWDCPFCRAGVEARAAELFAAGKPAREARAQAERECRVCLDDKGQPKTAPGIWREMYQLALHEDPRGITEIVPGDSTARAVRGRAAVVDAVAPFLRRWWHQARDRHLRTLECQAGECVGEEKVA